MPGKIKVKVLAGRNLPVMDRASDTTDAFVEIKFGGVTHKTDVCRKSLNPHWSSTEWYRFEVDESELQDEPLQLRLMDHDTYSANDAIGKVVISLAPLLAREANNAKTAGGHGGAVLSGWIPVFDTMHGIRGELNVIVKVELFSDFNKYKTSSCGVQFFHCPMIPPGYKATSIHGFVEELVVNDDPEYQWIDKIRTPRASNEARQVAFIKLSNQVQRLVGLKAAELGANAVVGYQQDFDLEGEAGVVARAVGTAVSITPLPTPSQPINIPACTQQQLRKYLDILSTDTEHITDVNEYFQSHPDELQRFLNILNPRISLFDDQDNIDDDDKSAQLTRQSSVKSYAGTVSIYQDNYISQKSLRHIHDDQTDLNKLLNRSDGDGDSDSSSTIKKIKKFKPTLFFKRLSSVRSRKSDKQDDSVSIKSNSSDTSKISLVDIKNEFRKFKTLKKPKFKKAFANKLDEGVGMASILARSVIHAHTSLACIAETQDSEHSPNSTTRRTSESEPQLNISDDEKAKSCESHDSKSERKVPDLLFSSLTNINEDNPETQRERKMSESCPTTPVVARSEALLKPGGPDFHSSVSSILSGESSEIYSSSEEDDESSDLKTDNERSYETTSSVIKSVLSQEVNPALIAHMERKLSILETSARNQFEVSKKQGKSWSQESKTESSETDESSDIDNTAKVEHLNVPSTSGVTDENTFVAPKPNTYHFKFHNPFVHRKSNSISAPCSPTESKSFVYRSSKRIKHQLSKISKSNMIKSLSHYSLLPKKKHEEPKKCLSHPNSSSDVTSKAPSDTVLGSPFLSYADLMSLDKESLDAKQRFHKSDELPHPNVSMYIGSEPVSRASLSGSLFPDDSRVHSRQHSVKKEKRDIKPSSLVHTAMETILIDKVQSLLAPTSPDPIPIGNNHFFNDVNEKLEKVEEDRNENAKNKSPISSGLIHTAMETILLDKVQSLLIPTTPDANSSKQFDYEPNMDNVSNAENHDTSRSNTESTFNQSSNGSLKELDNNKAIKGNSNEAKKSSNDNISVISDVKPTLIDKVKHFLEPKKHHEETPSLINNAVQTILMDKVQNILDPTNDSESVHKIFNYSAEESDDKKETTSNSEKEPSLVNTAMQTMLMEKVQSLMIAPDENASENVHRNKLVRQDSVDSVESSKMSKGTAKKPVLQHFHPILSGAPLETIPSLPESSIERSESLDVDGVDDCETNCASVCDNLHAACNVGRDREPRSDKDKGSPRHARHESYGGKDPAPQPMTNQNSSLNASSAPMGIHRRSSDSDLSVTPKGSSLNTSAGNVGSGGGAILRPSMNSNNLEMLEYPFLTMTEYPPGFIVHIGGTVCARSVKLVDGGGESALRAAWWAELRTELRAHARALRCNAVIAYTDTAAICEDVCVLSASGTAAVINLDCDFNADLEPVATNGSKSPEDPVTAECCSVAHVPYSPAAGPYRAELGACGGCRRARVPAVLLSTCAKPSRLAAYPKAVTLTAVAGRVRRAPPTGEPGARDISDQLPFLEYELHKLLLAKLRMQGANALFNLQTQVSIGERCVMALASGTAVRLTALPPPMPPRIKASENDKEALEIQKALWDTFTANKTANGFDIGVPELSTNGALPEVESEEVAPTLELSADKDACVLELDEAEDVETARSLSARRLHTRMQVFTPALRPARNAPPHAFAQVWRARFTLSHSGGAASHAAERHVSRALDGVTYKLRRLQPCAMLAPRFQLELPEDEIQLIVSGAAIPLVDPSKPDSNGVENGHTPQGTGDADDDIFTLDEEQQPKPVVEENTAANGQSPTMVSLTSLSYIVGARGTRRVCALRLLFVRETTAVRELGGLSGFLHTFTCEVLAIVRAYTAALGGNALTSFYITQLMLQDNAHKNQGQCLLSVGGDVVHITY